MHERRRLLVRDCVRIDAAWLLGCYEFFALLDVLHRGFPLNLHSRPRVFDALVARSIVVPTQKLRQVKLELWAVVQYDLWNAPPYVPDV